MNQHLKEVRNALLDLHKALVDSERAHYEKIVGVVQSPNHFLQLLTGDPWFAWLRQMSQLIVAMDEAMEEKEPLTAARVDALINQAGKLLTVTENGEGFAKSYYEALQRDPDVLLAHGKAIKALGPRN
jgi:hypothetical protein